MKGENRLLVTDEPVEVQDSRKTTDHFRGIYEIYLKFFKKIQKITTYNRLDLNTLGFWPIIPNNLPGHWLKVMILAPSVP